MRNLKRAFSLVLAVVMLVGMMAINTNAASNFADADEIVNKEAVEITAGMGLFAGSDGKFNPKGTVTRAQMATIIVKMLRGSDFNANAFKGAGNPFSDTAFFEGGWAEGYINACFQMGIVKGYGDGTFKPGKSVTTAEAVTMIINALKVDAGQGEWPLTVMAKASSMKLFGDLNPAPATNDALIRDQLAVITLEGLQYSDSGKSGYTVEGMSFVFDNMTDALKAAGYDATKITEAVGDDTLASSVYSMSVATGFLTGNKKTGADYTVVGEATFDVETDLDLVGHYVSVYYKAPAQGEYVEAYETYAVVDESAAVVVAEDINSAKEYKAAFGRNYDMKTDESGVLDVLVFDGAYNIVEPEAGETPYVPGQSAPAGTYVIYENKVVAFLRPGTAVASQIKSITDFGDEKTYTLAGEINTIDEADITVYDGAKKDDYVTYIMAGGQYVVSPVEAVKGTVARYTTNADGEIVITVGSAQYTLFDTANNKTDLAVDPAGLDLTTKEYTFYVTKDGKVIGWAGADGTTDTDVDVDNIVYALGSFSVVSQSTGGTYGEKVKKHYLQGVDTQGKEAHVLVAMEYDSDKDGVFGEQDEDEDTMGTVPAAGADQREGFYIISDPEDKDAKKEGVKNWVRIGVKNDPNNDTGLFYGYNRWESTSTTEIKWPTDGTSNNHICTTACPAEDMAGMTGGASSTYHANIDTTTGTFFIPGTKFLTLSGELGSELTTSAGGTGFTYTTATGDAMKFPMLFKKNDMELTEIVMVVIRKDLTKTSSSNIFVFDNTPVGTSAEGTLYTVYTAWNGAKREVVIYGTDGVSAPATGFWKYTEQEDGSWKQVSRVSNAEILGYTGMHKEVYINGLSNGRAVASFVENGNTVPYITGADATGANIVDLRTEEEKAESGISTITSVEQLANLAEHDTIAIKGHPYYYQSVSCIYITSVVNNPAGVFYIADPTNAIAVSQNGKVQTVDAFGTMKTGFFTTVKEAGLVKLQSVSGDEYRVNELITGVNGTIIATEDVETGTPKSLNVTNATKFADVTSLGISSLAEIKAAVEAGKKLSMACVAEAAGDAALVIITGQGDPYLADGDVVYVSGITGTLNAGAITADVKTGVKKDSEYTFDAVDVIYPATIDITKAAGDAYFTVGKDSEGAISLTFSHNVQFAKDAETDIGPEMVFFAPNTDIKADTVTEILVIDIEGYETGDVIYMKHGTIYNGGEPSANHFYGTSNTLKSIYRMRAATCHRKYAFAYHDVIDTMTSTYITLKNADNHNGTGDKCASYGFDTICGTAERKNSYEAQGKLKYNSSTKIIDLTGTGIDTMEKVKTATDAGEAIINTFVTGATSPTSGGTIRAILVLPLDSADIVVP